MSLWLQVAAGLALAYGLWRMFRLLRPGIAPAAAAAVICASWFPPPTGTAISTTLCAT